MNYNILQQTALILLCGLFSQVAYAQQRDFLRRSYDDAKVIAKNFFAQNRQALTSVSHHPSLDSISPIYCEPLRFIVDSCAQNAYYIFTRTDQNPGFVIISGAEDMPCILGYSDSEPFDTTNVPPALVYWLKGYESMYASLQNVPNTVSSSKETSQSTIAQTADILLDGVSPLLGQNQWGQDTPYNNLCPQILRTTSVTGCVATAMAQVMKAHEYPAVGSGSVTYTTRTNKIRISHDLSTDQFAWSDMLDEYSYIGPNSEQSLAVATLMYACGTSVKMDYCTSEQGGSGAYQYDLIPAYIEHFGYDTDASIIIRSYCSTADWHTLLINELNEGRPVNYAGSSLLDGGHSFVIDGYKPSATNKYPDYHVNWGWEGSCNGYYQIADLQPVENGQAYTKSGFTQYQQMTIGIRPENGENDKMAFLSTSNLRLSTINNKIQFSTTDIYNISYKDFSGSLWIVLTDELGNEVEIEAINQLELGYLEEKQNLQFNISIPDDLKAGSYNVFLRAYRGSGSETVQVLSPNIATLTITTSGDINNETSNSNDTTFLLGYGECELTPALNTETIEVNVYLLRNFCDEPFLGKLGLLLTDNLVQQPSAIGEFVTISELGVDETQEEHVHLTGCISNTWTDGNYRLYIGAQKTHSDSSYYYVSKYDYDSPYIELEEYYLPVKIDNGVVYINGNTYSTSEIPTIHTERGHRDNSIFFNLHGIPCKNAENKIVISDNVKRLTLPK